jgi:cytochrome d ubiquinol oxidase subunit II
MEADLVAGWALLAVVAYGILGGADYGGGIWDLFARGPRAVQQREAIAVAMGPVWEANHVWLIFLLVLLFSGFPPAYTALSLAMFIPGHVVLLGIVLRGAAFIFRDQSEAGRRLWSPVFGAASAVTPVLLGMSLGLLSNGAIRSIDGRSSFDLTAWFGPSPLLIGALAMAVCSYLAAVYLAVETRGELREDFRRRGLWTLVALVALSLGGLPILRSYDPHLWEGLTGRSSWVIVLGLAAAALSGSSLARRRFILARVAAVAYAASLLIGWGIAQYPYLIYPDFPIAGSAAREPALVFILWAVPLGMLVLVPSLVLLFRVFKRDVE